MSPDTPQGQLNLPLNGGRPRKLAAGMAKGWTEVLHYDNSPHAPRRREYPDVGSPDLRKKIAQELRSAREFHELTLEDVNAQTKINLYYLSSIEEGKFNFLPPVYIKLFIKAFAEVVEIRSDEFSRRLDELFASTRTKIQLENAGKMPWEEDEARRSEGANWVNWADKHRSILLWVIGSVLLLVLVFYYLLLPPKSPVTSGVVASAPPRTAPVDTIKAAPDTVIAAAPVAAAATKIDLNASHFRPMIIAEEHCYVRIEHNDSILYDFTLWPGNRLAQEFPNPIKVVLGNAPGVRIVIGSDTLERFPADRKIKSIVLGPQGVIRSQ